MPFTRRRALQTAAAGSLAGAANAAATTEPSGSLTDVPGVKVGHWTSDRRPTGCTVILTESGATAGVDVRGGGPGTRETDLLRPEMSVQRVHAVVLSGGSAYGLVTADGVMQHLEEQGVGFRAGRFVVPIVPAAILFDLGMGDGAIRPSRTSGYEAARRASTAPVEQGTVGAGAGATVGKMLGAARSMKGGLGSASLRVGELVVGAVVAVNAIGDVVDPATGEIVAGALAEDSQSFADAAQLIRQGLGFSNVRPQENTSIGVVAINANCTQAQATKIAQMAHDGLARTIRPAHMPFDGDTIFALATGGESADHQLLGLAGALAADAVAQAVLAAVMHAESAADRPSRREILGRRGG